MLEPLLHSNPWAVSVSGLLGVLPLPDGLQVSEASEGFLAVVLAFVVFLLAGLLLNLRRMRHELEKETATLKRSENHLRTMGDNLPHMAIFQLVQDVPSGRYFFPFISSGFEQMLGLDRQGLLQDARQLLDHVYESDIETLQRTCTTAAERLEPANIDLRVLDADGSYKWLNISAIPQRRDKQLVWDGFMQDVSAAKAAEQAITAESRNFQNLFETIDDFLIVCNMDGRLVHSNPAVEQRLGFSHLELADMSIFELYPQGARPEVYRVFAEVQSAASGTCSQPLQASNGTALPVEINLFQGVWKQQKAVFGVARDMARRQQTETALRESQKMLQLIIDSIPMSVSWKDQASVYLGCNKAFMKECSLETVDEVIGKTPHDLFDNSIAPDIVQRDQGVMNTNQALMGYAESHTRRDGSIGWREISLIPLHNGADRAEGVLGIWRDITEQNRAEERLKRTLDDMERFNLLMRGRERRTLELKSEVNDLLEQLGMPRKYRTTADELT